MKDELFIRGNVPMTKEEIRGVCLAKLELYQAETLLDIGTGTGSIAVEAALNYPSLQVTAVDANQEAIALLKENQQKFGVENITSFVIEAPFETQEKFDAIFIGGTGGNMEGILSWSFQHLSSQGKLVMNFILQESVMEAMKWLKEKDKNFSAVQVQIGKYTALGSGHYYKPSNPVIILEAGSNLEPEDGKEAKTWQKFIL